MALHKKNKSAKKATSRGIKIQYREVREPAALSMLSPEPRKPLLEQNSPSLV